MHENVAFSANVNFQLNLFAIDIYCAINFALSSWLWRFGNRINNKQSFSSCWTGNSGKISLTRCLRFDHWLLEPRQVLGCLPARLEWQTFSKWLGFPQWRHFLPNAGQDFCLGAWSPPGFLQLWSQASISLLRKFFPLLTLWTSSLEAVALFESSLLSLSDNSLRRPISIALSSVSSLSFKSCFLTNEEATPHPILSRYHTRTCSLGFWGQLKKTGMVHLRSAFLCWICVFP